MPPRHPDPHVQAAVEHALAEGWRLEKAGPRAHAWVVLLCPRAARDDCSFRVPSTLRSPETHVKQLRRRILKCPHAGAVWDMAVPEYEFDIILRDSDVSADACDRLYGLCGDVSSSRVSGVEHVAFNREADALDRAIASAIRDVQRAGLTPTRIDIVNQPAKVPA